jgi:hypothetical protein
MENRKFGYFNNIFDNGDLKSNELFQFPTDGVYESLEFGNQSSYTKKMTLPSNTSSEPLEVSSQNSWIDKNNYWHNSRPYYKPRYNYQNNYQNYQNKPYPYYNNQHYQPQDYKNFSSNTTYRSHQYDLYLRSQHLFPKEMDFDSILARLQGLLNHAIYFHTINTEDEDKKVIKLAVLKKNEKRLMTTNLEGNFLPTGLKQFNFPEDETILKYHIHPNSAIIIVTSKPTGRLIVYIFKINNWDAAYRETELTAQINFGDTEANRDKAQESYLTYDSRLEFVEETTGILQDNFVVEGAKNGSLEVRCERPPYEKAITTPTDPVKNFMEFIYVGYSGTNLTLMANTRLRGEERCVCLAIDTLQKEVKQKLILDTPVHYARTFKLSKTQEGIFGSCGSKLYLIVCLNGKMELRFADLQFYGESNTPEFKSSSYNEKIYIHCKQSGTMYTFDQKLQYIDKNNLKGVFHNSDGRTLHFFKKDKDSGDLLYRPISIPEFVPRTVQRDFRPLQDFTYDGGVLQAHHVTYNRILLVNKLDQGIKFTIYDHKMHRVVEGFELNVSRKDYDVIYEKRKILVTPKPHVIGGESKFFDLNVILGYNKSL